MRQFRRTGIAVFCVAGMACAADLSGRVVEDHSGNPLASAEVRVFKIGMRTLAADLDTDTDGRFGAPGLPDGEYRLEVSKPNYVGSTVSMHGVSAGLQVRLVRTGVISGQVVDAQGQPIRGATVYALPKPVGGGPLRTIGAGGRTMSARLNERGQYRLHNLPPGEYAVAVTYGASTAVFGSTGGADVRAGLGSGVVLYPENTRPRFFALAGGEEFRNIDFAIAPTTLYSVSGKVDLPDPKTHYWLALIPADQPALAAAVAETKPDGSFRFEGVAGGAYTLTASGPMRGYGGKGIPGDAPYFGRTTVSVASNLDGVAVVLSRGKSSLFILRAAGSPGAGGACPTIAEITLSALEDFSAMIDRTGPIDSTKGLPLTDLAPARYQVSLSKLGESCYLASNTILDFSHGVPSAPVAVMVAPAGSIRGKLAGATRPADYSVTLVAADAVNGTEPVQVVFAEADGRFQFGGLRPGRYRIAAQPAGQASKMRWVNAAARMIEIEIAAGAPTEMELPAPASGQNQ